MAFFQPNAFDFNDCNFSKLGRMPLPRSRGFPTPYLKKNLRVPGSISDFARLKISHAKAWLAGGRQLDHDIHPIN